MHRKFARDRAGWRTGFARPVWSRRRGDAARGDRILMGRIAQVSSLVSADSARAGFPNDSMFSTGRFLPGERMQLNPAEENLRPFRLEEDSSLPQRTIRRGVYLNAIEKIREIPAAI